MLENDALTGSYLLPQPKEIRLHGGTCRVCPQGRLESRVDDPRIELAARRWLSATGESLVADSTRTRLRIAVDLDVVPHAQGYRLRIDAGHIDLTGTSSQGCFHGLQTLAQMCRLGEGAIPCGMIVDWPDFETRGLLQDVSRGRVPTLGTLKRLVARLAGLKVNQLQLYIEHAFVFSFDTEICDSDNGLTPDEVRELDAYCRDRFIDLVPAMATLGHMGRVLSMPKYRHLAEVESPLPWAEMSWPQRARGLTLDCANPQSHRLVERMWSDVLDAFSSPFVNICGDEPWDLGRGRNRERFAALREGEPYIEHIVRTHSICAARGRKSQFWSDVVKNHPDLFDRLPADSTVLHWGYDDDADYAATGSFVDSGLSTFVCPGTSGWKRVLNAIDLAERNIAHFAKVGKQCGATGLLNTDWGDHGHFNLPACSSHGIALGAAAGWSADHPVGAAFDEAFSRVVLGVEDGTGVALLRKASRTNSGMDSSRPECSQGENWCGIAARCETWRLLWMPLRAVRDESSLPEVAEVVEVRSAASDLRRWCEQTIEHAGGDAGDIRELAIASTFSELCAEKMLFALRADEAYDTRRKLSAVSHQPSASASWSEKLMQAGDAYAACWRARNKPSGLGDILQALSVAATDIRG